MCHASRNTKVLIICGLIIAALLLCGCGTAPESLPEPTAEPKATREPTPMPKPTELPGIKLGIKTYTAETETIDISEEHIGFEELRSAAPGLPGVKELSLGLTSFSKEELEELSSLFPGAQLSWSVDVLGKTVSSDTKKLSFPQIKSEDVPELCSAIGLLPELEHLELVPPDGATPLSAEELDQISAAAHGARIDCVFSLYGKLAGPDTEELRYFRKRIGDKGIEVFRAAMPYLHSLKLLRLADCEITDNDSMAALRADYPQVNVVWSIEVAGSSIMTDTTLIHTPLLRDKHVHLLQYFPDVLYFDIGHNRYLTSIDFLKYLPKLTVFIMALTQIKDITPLANCPDLEFLELFSTPIEDISVLSSLTKLEYLNIGTMQNLSDITPVFGLTNLKMVRICGSSFDHVSRKKVEELKTALPDCFVSDGPGDPTTAGGWRFDENHNYTPRYALLRKQMLYNKRNWKDRVSNSPSA